MKYRRQNLILRIIKEEPIGTHTELIEALRRHGVAVTQATVSRDIKELGLVKVQSKSGAVYAAAKSDAGLNTGLFESAVISVRSALHMIVIKTQPGMAGGVCAVIDNSAGLEILGSIAGDDTIFAVTENEEKARLMCEKIKNLLGLKGE